MAWHSSASVAVDDRKTARGGSVAAATVVTIVLALACVALLVEYGPWAADPAIGGMRILAITPGDQRGLTPADADAVGNAVSGVTLLSRVVSRTAVVSAGTVAPRLGIQAVDPSYAALPEASLAQGAFFTAEDSLAANRVAVLGSRAASSLFANADSPLGQTIHIGDVPFTVIGVLSSQTSVTADAVLVPFQTGRVRLFGVTDLGEVLLQVRDPSQTDTIQQAVQQMLRSRHQVRAGQPDGFTIGTPPASAPPTSGPAARFLNRFVSLSRQTACEAKALCAPVAQTVSSPT